MFDTPTRKAVLRIAIAGAVTGAAYSFFAHHGPTTGLVIGAANGAAIAWLELVVLRRWAARWFERLPFLGTIAVRAVLFLAVVRAIDMTLIPPLSGFHRSGGGDAADIAFGFGASFVGSAALGVADLVGLDVLFPFLTGRYHRPRVEERALMFLDLCDSTAIAERLGGKRYLDFLNAVFADLAAAIADNGGEIHKYVGDEVIAVWRLAQGENPPRILAAWAAARRRIAANAERYRAEFGLAPDFRAAMHAGEVVVGELGARRKEIAMIGDPMNTAARMLGAARDLGRPAVASAALMQRLAAPPDGVSVTPIAPLPLRGKAEPLTLALVDMEIAIRIELLSEA